MKPPHIKPTFLSDRVRTLLHLTNREIADQLNCTIKHVQHVRRGGKVRPPRHGEWSDERIERLKKLWADGLSASQCAADLGGVTRNSVISKVHRLGLAGRTTTSRVTTRRKHVLRPAAKPLSPAAQVIKAIKRDGLPLPPPAETDIPRVSMDALEAHHCRWVCVADRNIDPLYSPQFCGERKLPNIPYCEPHALRAGLVRQVALARWEAQQAKTRLQFA